MAKASAGERLCFDTPATIADYFMEELRHKEDVYKRQRQIRRQRRKFMPIM